MKRFKTLNPVLQRQSENDSPFATDRNPGIKRTRPLQAQTAFGKQKVNYVLQLYQTAVQCHHLQLAETTK